MEIFETELSEVIQRMPGVKSFRFRPGKEIDFQAGQFFFVTIKTGEGERTKPFSFSNSPTEKGYVEFTKRITASEFSQALNRLVPGDWAKLKLPLGSFTLEGKDERIAFLSGGIGITPIRSMCKFATDRQLDTGIVLLYGNSKPADIIFRQDFEEMAAANKNIRIVHTLTSSDIDKNTWPGRTGYINGQMVAEEIPDFEQRIFYLCGPPKMVEGLTDILKNKLGLTEDKIKTENFSGY